MMPGLESEINLSSNLKYQSVSHPSYLKVLSLSEQEYVVVSMPSKICRYSFKPVGHVKEEKNGGGLKH